MIVSRMIKFNLKTSLLILLFLNLYLGENIVNTIKLKEEKISDFQVKSFETPQTSVIVPVHEEISTKVERITSYEEHTPISIDGNTDFNDTAYLEGWPGNGSVDDPYIIQELNITGPSGSNLIDIQNTNVYFQINNSLLVGGSKGIYLDNVFNGLIANNTIIYNNDGINLYESENNVLFNNNASYNVKNGIYLTLSPNNAFINNVVEDNDEIGIGAYFSGNNRIISNSFTNNGLMIRGSYVTDYLQAEVENNTINGRSLIFWSNLNSGTVPSGVGQIILVNCRSIIVADQNLSFTSVSLLAAFSSNLKLSNNNIFNNTYGILFDFTENCGLFNNSITYNSIGISLSSQSEDNNLQGNIISYNSYGIQLSSDSNKIFGNTISSNSINGIYLAGAANNAIFGNVISNTSNYGIYLFVSDNNLISWNDFVNNHPGGPSQAYDSDTPVISNIFDYNYWSNWTTPDLNYDGIVDSPYTVYGNSNNQDLHPLTTHVHLLPLIVIFPNGGTTLNGIISIQWAPTMDHWGHQITYTVYYSNDSGSTWIFLASDLNSTSYQWDTTTVDDGTEYLIKVVGRCSEGLIVEDISDKTFMIQNDVVTPPFAPQALIASAGELSVYLSWSTPSSDGGSPITGYRVYRGTSSGEYTVLFINSDTNYNDTSVHGDVTYYYVVTAINSIGESTSSNEVTTTPLLPPSPTQTSTVVTVTSTIYETTWVTQTKSTAEFATLAILAGFLGILWIKRRDRFRK